jgi:hypothetical protein
MSEIDVDPSYSMISTHNVLAPLPERSVKFSKGNIDWDEYDNSCDEDPPRTETTNDAPEDDILKNSIQDPTSGHRQTNGYGTHTESAEHT